MSKVYTIGIKRRFLPIFKHYFVKKHQIETEIRGHQIPQRLVMELRDGATVVVGDIEKRTWKVYPDFIAVVKRIEAEKKAWALDMALRKEPSSVPEMKSLEIQVPTQETTPAMQ